MRRIAVILLTFMLLVLIISCSGKRNPTAPLIEQPATASGTYTPTVVITATYTSTTAVTATYTSSPVVTAANTFTTVVTATNTSSPVVTPTITPSPILTATATTTKVITATAATTKIITATITPSPILTATSTATKIITATNTVTITSTATATQTATGTISVPVSPTLNATPPAATVKIISIHHSTGQHWLESGYGGLGTALNANNYFVSDTNYGWSAPGYDQGSYTDTTDWQNWFRDEVMPFVFTENNNLLTYMAGHTDKLFILIIPPPMQFISDPAATRVLSNWLYDRQNGWLKNYTHGNVYAYDYYNVLTHQDNHHRLVNGVESHEVNNAQNTLYYPTNSGDDHPTVEGQEKATSEFLPLLNAWYRQWKGL